jgi:hypothetical protein
MPHDLPFCKIDQHALHVLQALTVWAEQLAVDITGSSVLEGG